MGDIPGADLLMNMSSMGDTKLPALESVSLDFADFDSNGDLPSSSSSSSVPAPKLVPSADDIGPVKSWDGIDNFNAESYMKPVKPIVQMSEDALMKEKYEILRKFERLQKLGVPIRKRFTMDSPLDEMKMELEFIRKEKAMDATIKQFSEWFITGMSAFEWGSKNINMLKMFGLQLDGLSQSAQMNVGDLEEDFEELYELYGDKMRMHPLVRIPMRTCIMVYMVHLTNQMAMKSPVPNIQDILRQNPDIARQMAAEAMKTQTQSFKQQAAPSVPAPRQMFAPPPAPSTRMPAPQEAPSNFDNPLSGLMSFLGGTQQPPSAPMPPPQVQTKKVSMPKMSMPPPQMPSFMSRPPTPTPVTTSVPKTVGAEGGLSSILSGIRAEKSTTPLKSALRKTSSSSSSKSPKNSVVIKL